MAFVTEQILWISCFLFGHFWSLQSLTGLAFFLFWVFMQPDFTYFLSFSHFHFSSRAFSISLWWNHSQFFHRFFQSKIFFSCFKLRNFELIKIDLQFVLLSSFSTDYFFDLLLFQKVQILSWLFEIQRCHLGKDMHFTDVVTHFYRNYSANIFTLQLRVLSFYGVIRTVVLKTHL